MSGRTVGTFIIVRYIVGVRYSEVSVKQGTTVFRFTNIYQPPKWVQSVGGALSKLYDECV